MRKVPAENSKTEKMVRRLVHSMGFRFRLHGKELPGKPDMVFPSRKKAIFVNGCFWHGHNCPRGGRIPKTNTEYWIGKISRNRERDKRNQGELEKLGWKVMTVWECRLKDLEQLSREISAFLTDE